MSAITPEPPFSTRVDLLKSTFEQAVYEVYRGTEPGQDSELAISLRVGRRADDCTQWLIEHGARSAVVLSAWHADGRRTDLQSNLQAQAALKARILMRPYRWLPARCVSEDLTWADDAFCVFDASTSDIDTWLIDFQQATALVIQQGTPPQLVLHPAYRRG